MKAKIAPFWLPYVWLILILQLCQTSSSLHARSLEEIKKTGEIRICVVPGSPAYAVINDPSCQEDCSFSGPVIREVLAFTRTLGNNIRPVFHPVKWDEQFRNESGKTIREGVYTPHLMECGKCDLFPTHLTKTEWRLKKLDFAILFSNRMMVIVNKTRKKQFKTVSDLAGKVTSTDMNSSHHTWLLKQNAQRFASDPVTIRFMPAEKGFDALENHQIDFLLADSDVALWAVAQRLKESMVAFPVGAVDEIGWAFRREDRDLKNAVQQFFNAQLNDKNSDLNQIWKQEYGISLIQLKNLIHAMH